MLILQIHACPQETADAKWHTREEIEALPEKLFHPMLRDSLKYVSMIVLYFYFSIFSIKKPPFFG